MSKIVTFMMFFTLTTTSFMASANTAADITNCNLQKESVLVQFKAAHVYRVQADTTKFLIQLYAKLKIAIDPSAITYKNIETDLFTTSDTSWNAHFYLTTSMEVEVAAGPNSENFTSTARLTLNKDHVAFDDGGMAQPVLKLNTDRKNVYDPLGRLISTKLVCSLNADRHALDANSELYISNASTQACIAHIKKNDLLTAEVELP